MIELVVWRVPQAVPPSTHEFKYRAVYAVNGVRVVGFDNERGKATGQAGSMPVEVPRRRPAQAPERTAAA